MDTFIKPEDINNLNSSYGPAREMEFDPIPMLPWEYDLLVKSMNGGIRQHDVTMFIRKNGDNGRFVCIQKPYYRNSGIYRAPSGGVHPGETIEEGLKREMLEETGLHVDIDRFLLITRTEFISPDGKDRQPWTSYIFLGHDTRGDMIPRDTREISDIRLCEESEMLGPIAGRMLDSGWGGFRYRVLLTRESLKIINNGAGNKQ